MSSSRIGVRRNRRLIGALALGAALVCGSAPAPASAAGSSSQDRQRFVVITHNLEQNPLDPHLGVDRDWALKWLVDAPDVSVRLCGDTLGGLLDSKYAYGPQIVYQYMFSIAVFMIQHPETANDPNAQQLAGVEGALKAYRSILRDKPEAKSPALEALLQTQARGALPDFVRKASTDCSAKK
ncbi:MAG TPA: hypothetical protein VFW19_01080 [Allosphingosinicella sp.]|nr:hypothetical protein [Allosphingosinicella sp.]